MSPGARLLAALASILFFLKGERVGNELPAASGAKRN